MPRWTDEQAAEAIAKMRSPIQKVTCKWVGQEERWGCVIACVAMLCDLTYWDAKALFAEEYPNVGTQHGAEGYEAQQTLIAFGWERTKSYHRFAWEPKPDTWPPSPFSEIHQCSVQCGPDPNLTHSVLMLSDGTVLDPLGPEPKRLTDYVDVFTVNGWKRSGLSEMIQTEEL